MRKRFSGAEGRGYTTCFLAVEADASLHEAWHCEAAIVLMMNVKLLSSKVQWLSKLEFYPFRNCRYTPPSSQTELNTVLVAPPTTNIRNEVFRICIIADTEPYIIRMIQQHL